MFRPNTTCIITETQGYSVHGEPAFGIAQTVPCGIVRLDLTSQKTSVRTDSSASRGNAEEEVSRSVLLFPATVTPKLGSKVEIMGITLRIMAVQPRLTVRGGLDHYQCTLEAWTD